MNNVGLTKDAYNFLVLLYKEYLSRLKDGYTSSQAVEFSDDPIGITDDVFATEPESDEYLNELSDHNFVECTVGGSVILTRTAIRTMETRFEDKIANVLEFIKKIK